MSHQLVPAPPSFLRRGVDTCFLGSGLRLEFELEPEDHGSQSRQSPRVQLGNEKAKKPIASPPDMHVLILHPVMLRCKELSDSSRA